MKEFLTNQINNHTGQLLFDLVPVIIILVVLIIIFILSDKVISIWRRLVICVGLVAAMALFLLDFIPLAIVQFDLIKDYNQPVLLSKEGVVENQFLFRKLDFAVIDKERFILSGELKAESGEKVKIEYFENSKYIYTLTIEDD